MNQLYGFHPAVNVPDPFAFLRHCLQATKGSVVRLVGCVPFWGPHLEPVSSVRETESTSADSDWTLVDDAFTSRTNAGRSTALFSEVVDARRHV